MAMSDTRGLVVSSPIEVSGTRLLMKSNALDPQELRFSLLFWERLDFPQNNMIHIASALDEQFLEGAGILTRTRVQFSGSGQMAEIYRQLHIAAFKFLDNREPGVWSLATGERSISFLDSELEIGRGALVQLHRAIPVPDQTVALQDILEFRKNRRPELLALREHLEQVYHRVQNAGDGPLAWNTEITALNRALADHLKASKEWGVKLRWVSVDVGLNLVGGVAATAVGLSQGIPLLQAAAIASPAFLSLKGGPSLSKRASSTTPFRYVSRFHEELFVGA